MKKILCFVLGHAWAYEKPPVAPTREDYADMFSKMNSLEVVNIFKSVTPVSIRCKRCKKIKP